MNVHSNPEATTQRSVSTTRQTIQIYRDHQVFELTTEMREHTVNSIMHRCGLRKSA